MYKILLIFIIVGVACSCTYEPEGEFVNPVEPPGEPSAIEINLQATNDTIVVRFYGTYARFNFNTSPYDVLGGKISLNGDSISPLGRGYNHSLSINLHELNLGVNKLKVELYTNSNTGSLADLAGVEGYYFSREFVVYRYSNEIQPMLLTGEIFNGTFKVKWDKYEMYDFKQYKLTDPTGYNTLLLTDDVDSTYYIDTTVVEGWGNGYLIDVEVDEKGWLNAMDYPFYGARFDEKPLTSKYIGNYKVKLSWEPTEFYRNLKKYQLWKKVNRRTSLIYETDDWTQTEWIEDSIPLGGFVEFYLKFVSKDKNWQLNLGPYPDAVERIGEGLYSGDWPIPLGFSKKLIQYDNENINEIRIIDETRFEISEVIKLNNTYDRLLISHGGKSLYGMQYGIGLTPIDCSSFQEGTTIYYSNIIADPKNDGDLDLSKCFIRIDESGNIYFEFREKVPPSYSYQYQMRYRLNIATNSLEKLVAPFRYGNHLYFSVNGDKVIMNSNKIYSLIDGEYVLDKELPYSVLNYDASNETILVQEGSKLNLYDLNSYGNVGSFELGEGSNVWCFSPDYKRAMVFEKYTEDMVQVYSVVDLVNGNKLCTFPSVSPNGYRLFFLDYAYVSNKRVSFKEKY